MPVVRPHRQWHICFAGFCNLMSATVPKIWLMPPLLSPVIGSNSTGNQSQRLSCRLARCEPEVWLNRPHKQVTQRDKQPISQRPLVAHLTGRLESNLKLCAGPFFFYICPQAETWVTSLNTVKYLSSKLLVQCCSEERRHEPAFLFPVLLFYYKISKTYMWNYPVWITVLCFLINVHRLTHSLCLVSLERSPFCLHWSNLKALNCTVTFIFSSCLF